MKRKFYHYTECGLDNVYLFNGFTFASTSRGQAVSIKDIDGLHTAIGLYLVRSKKDLSGDEIRFLRLEMLMSQGELAHLLGVSDQAIRRWEQGKITMPKPSESLLRLLYKEHTHHQEGKISSMLKSFANLEEPTEEEKILFKDTSKGWEYAA